MSPGQVDEMSLWQFAAFMHGFKTANGIEDKPPAPTADEFRAMSAWAADLTRGL